MLKIEDITNIKVRVTPEQNVIIQNACFDLGVYWADGDDEVNTSLSNCGFLFVDNQSASNLELSGCVSENTFLSENGAEVQAEDLIAKIQDKSNMSFEEKMKALHESDVVADDIKYINIVRLCNGNLSDVGNAIIEGEVVEFRDDGAWIEASGSYFAHPKNSYRIKSKKFNLGGIEIPMPINIKDIKIGDRYYISDIVFDRAYDFEFDNSDSACRLLKSNLCHKTKENAEAHLAALRKLHGVE